MIYPKLPKIIIKFIKKQTSNDTSMEEMAYFCSVL